MVVVTVRYFAAAAAAAGADQEIIDLPEGHRLADLTRLLAARTPEMDRILGRCSYLRDGVAVRDHTVGLCPGTVVDVLPPFAGG